LWGDIRLLRHKPQPQPSPMAKYYVSTTGRDTNSGQTATKPFRTIEKGISVLSPGDTLNLRRGNYAESVVIKDKQDITIRSYREELATIDGCVLEFRQANNRDWEPASVYEPNTPDILEEYVSCQSFALDSDDDRVNRGAFLNQEPYTRLITYSRLEDLRAKNQTWDLKLSPSDSRPGPEVIKGPHGGHPTGFRRPWVYMGPGLFFNKGTGRVHIRLSHTNNNIPGLADYRGELDPRKLGLAISHKDRPTLLIQKSNSVRFENLSIRFGGDFTIKVEKSKGTEFDHVRILASTYGVNLGAGEKTILSHCEVNGGLPSWYFRSDRKDVYKFKDGNTVKTNNLGAHTSQTLLFGSPEHTNLTIHNCEFLNGHDLSFFGHDIEFRYNWVHNLNDEALILDMHKTSGLHILQNVITQCLSGISFAGDKTGGQIFIYRNLFDLRRPTAGRRPSLLRDQEVFRYGHFYKSNHKDGPLDLFQNTCLVLGQNEQVSYSHYGNTGSIYPRRSFNNILIAVNPDADSDIRFMYLPPPTFPGPTDGNCYFRIGMNTKPLFVFGAYKFQNVLHPGRTFKYLESVLEPDDALRPNSDLFQQSKTQYPPGYEANSIEDDPLFRRIAADGTPRSNDDLRLQSNSPARGKGIVLPSELKPLDPLAPLAPSPPFPPSEPNPDIGCYQFGKPGLMVGVDGRRHFP
jgi:Right handed beta helix region